MKPCPRNIDRPFTLLGLEMEEIGFLFIWLGVLQAVSDILISLPTTIVLGVIIKKIKEGKPKGYLTHYLYKKFNLKIPGLVPLKKRWKIW
ncbi:MAG TPA: type IV conjugative transfer system protein TraL [Candidatus Ratteibacteria bacterium]|nr:type IV conjugative transfer system protein TraL [Candidatus Ratteibacteria bacterium]